MRPISQIKGTPAAPRLSSAEKRLRDVEVARLNEVARRTGDPEHVRWLGRQAQRIRNSDPVCCFVDRQRSLSERMAGASPRVDRQPDGSLTSEVAVYQEMRRQHREEHVYPSGLEAVVDNAFLGKPVPPQAEEILSHHRKHHGRA